MTSRRMSIPASLLTTGLVSTGLVAAGLWSAPAQAATSCDWSAPARLSGGDQSALPYVSSGLPGRPAITFYDIGADVRASASDGSEESDLGAASTQPNPSMRPQLIVSDQNSRGQVAAVFTHNVGKEGRVYAVLRGADGTWTSRIRLTQDGAFGLYPQVAIDDKGRAIAVWTQNAATGGTYIVGRALSPKGAKGKLFRLGNGESEDAVIAAGSSGTVAVAWDEVGATTNPVWSAVSPDGGRDWTDATRVSAAQVSTDNKSIDIAASGRVGLIWDQEDGGDSAAVQVVAASTKRDNAWIDPVALSRGDHLSMNGGIATGGTDRFTVAWITGPTSGLPGRNVVKVASGPAIDALGAPKRLDQTADTLSLMRAHVAVNAQGVAAVSWERSPTDAQPPSGVTAGLMAAVKTQDRWQPAQKLRGWRASPGYSRVGIDSSGEVTVAWDQTVGEQTSVAMSQCAAGPVR